jgi:NADH:ubiquinone reductase (H+-translocating)
MEGERGDRPHFAHLVLLFHSLSLAVTFLNLGLLAYVGGGEALTQFQLGDVPIFSYAGSVSFMLWRSVYLVKQVATRNRILVLFDWMKTRVFGRDTTRL